MTNPNIDKLSAETKRRFFMKRFLSGVHELRYSVWKRLILICCLVVLVTPWMFLNRIIQEFCPPIIVPMMTDISHFLYPITAILFLIILLILFGSPYRAGAISRDLQRAGVFNEAEEPPILVVRKHDPKNPKLYILEFHSIGIPLSTWQENQAKIEAALNMYIASFHEGKDRQTVILHAVPADHAFSNVLPWSQSLLSPDNFTLILGESLIGPVSVNLAQIPHILIGGTTGSGKTVLLRNLLYQCKCKGAQLIIADFKGGVDFSGMWETYGRICCNEDELIPVLEKVIVVMVGRKKLLRESGCSNIDEFNIQTGEHIDRIVFACDEVSELLDKTGLTKEQKEKVQQIEGMLSSIARVGRAFGVHLLLATQRPDAGTINGNIRNNMGTKICGRADDNLSMVILGNTSANDLIPKDSRGRFILEDGTVFQGYFMDDSQLKGCGV